MPPLTDAWQHGHRAVLLVHRRAWGQSARVEAHIVSCPWTICHAQLCPSHWSHHRLTSQMAEEGRRV
jgi:hypothetical protein